MKIQEIKTNVLQIINDVIFLIILSLAIMVGLVLFFINSVQFRNYVRAVLFNEWREFKRGLWGR